VRWGGVGTKAWEGWARGVQREERGECAGGGGGGERRGEKRVRRWEVGVACGVACVKRAHVGVAGKANNKGQAWKQKGLD